MVRHFTSRTCLLFWVDFVNLGWICHSRLNLSFRAEIVILDLIAHFGLNICADLVIMGRKCRFGLNFLFWAKFVTLWLISHFDGYMSLETSCVFRFKYVILAWDCHSGQTRLNWHFRLNSTLWAEFVIPGWICPSGLNPYWIMAGFVVQVWICHSGMKSRLLNWSFLRILYRICHSPLNL